MLIRDFSILRSKAKLREYASKPDLQVIQSVQALDEVDRTVNILEARIKEWYGLHFPELERILESNDTYARFVINIGRRDSISIEELEKLGISKVKIDRLLDLSSKSKGSNIQTSDMHSLTILAKETIRLSSVREKLANYVERTMELVAPNITSVAGATIGARVIAKAGDLEKMARLPASTIQVLGAEKALFRSLRSGSRPPKHGILFQHQAVHTAPKWQRGKIARSLAAKMAIAARIDLYRGSVEDGLKIGLDSRFEEIRTKYNQPPDHEKVVKKERRNKNVRKKWIKSKNKKSKNKR
jgi:nucleolar protein 56